MESLIPADNHFAVMGALFVIAGLGFLAEKTRIGAILTGAVVAIFLAIFLSNLPVPLAGADGWRWGTLIPQTGAAYSFVFSYFVPLLIPLFLMKADMRKILFETGRMTGAFLLAAVATVIGAVVAFTLFDFGDLEAALAGLFTATYIGGSVNYAALADITGLAENQPSLVSAATAVDNLFSGVFLAFLAIIPGVGFIASRFVRKDHSQATVAEEENGRATALTLTITLAYALVLVAIADVLTGQLGALLGALGVEDASRAAGNWRYGILTLITLIPATFLSKRMSRLHGGYELGVGLAFVFFAAIAAGANIPSLLRDAPLLLALVTTVLAVHAVVLFGVGSLLRFSLPELITASNAAVLGATTAPALAAAKGWKELITPGVLVGVLGYVIGTLIATAVYQFWPG
ncbi:DUF819 domain-containing protein [Hyphobacterium sp.]|uniref:DUF819 family protein n=1 Tax=Hyphobacterium sp. TaxID=2004662 RepID=UPI003B52CE96